MSHPVVHTPAISDAAVMNVLEGRGGNYENREPRVQLSVEASLEADCGREWRAQEVEGL